MIKLVMSDPAASQPDFTLMLREEFRSHLDTFYAQLKLAPPYESVEKAIRALITAVHGLPKTEQARIMEDPALKWLQFRQAFETSGLSKKHRGIIARLARNGTDLHLRPEYDHFLKLFTS
jgi:hypothetical protein